MTRRKTFPLVHGAPQVTAPPPVSPQALVTHALTTPSRLQNALNENGTWTPADTWAMQSSSLAVVIGIVRGHEKRGDCDPKVRESLMAMKLQIDRAIRNAENAGIYRIATADMPLDLD